MLTPEIPLIRYLVLLITTRCNLGCRYCYLPQDKRDGIDMTPEIMDRAVAIAASHGKRMHVQVSGGEPTLNREMVFKTVRQIHTTAPNATVALQTNATLIDDELALFFRHNHVQIGVSIDGPPQVHERQRGGFGKTLAGIECLEKHHVPWRATAVVTEDSVGELWRLALLISKYRTARGIGLDFLTLKESASKNGISPPRAEAVREGIGRLLATIDKINRFSTPPLVLREERTVASGKGSGFFCHAAKGESMAVYPDGTVYPCSQLCGEKEWCAGSVTETIDHSRLRVNAPSLSGNKCGACELSGDCPGDCPARLVYNNESVSRNICALYHEITSQNKKETYV